MSATLEAHGTGLYVNTLTMDVRKDTFAGADRHLFAVHREHFEAGGERPWCYLIKGSVPCVVLKGFVQCVAPREPGRTDAQVLGRLPDGMRPKKALRFAGLCWASNALGMTSSDLVTLECLPDGCIRIEAAPGGKTEVQPGSVIDLSAIRFSTGNGISVIDDVLLYLCDINGTRLVCMQGELHERSFNMVGRKRLALIPQSCRPANEMLFVSPGTWGGYHLLWVRPDPQGFNMNGSGDLMWHDSTWHRDRISVNGLMWETEPAAVLIPNPMAATEATEGQIIRVMDFQRYLTRRYGSVEEAWFKAFDLDDSGSVNFTEFGLGCKKVGYCGNAIKLWAALDIDRSGEISLDELAADSQAMLSQVRAALASRPKDPEAATAKLEELERASTAAPSTCGESRPASQLSSRWNSRPSSRSTMLEFLAEKAAQRHSASSRCQTPAAGSRQASSSQASRPATAPSRMLALGAPLPSLTASPQGASEFTP